ncbi:MAG: hypothetical protein HFE83_09240 [Lachnospiraceae bacterium]|jgi:hypothetical protein|nr:hypothetical protein [Lachnospiraceae bacterium]
MQWYERLYVGEQARKKRYATIQAVRKARHTGYYVLTPAANGQDLFDLIPAAAFSQEYYRQKDILVVGIAADFADAAALSGRIVEEMYQKTGGFDVQEFLKREKE